MKLRNSNALFHLSRRASLIAGLLLLAGGVAAKDAADGSEQDLYVEVKEGLVTLSVREVSLDHVLEAIASQSDLVVIGDATLVQRITIDFERLALADAIHRIMREQSYLLYAADANEESYSTIWVFSDGPAADAPTSSEAASDVEFLHSKLLSDDPKTRHDALKALRKLKGDDVVAPISLALTDGERDIRVKAVYALADIGGSDAAAALAAASADENAYVRAESAYALGMIGGDTAIRVLEHALRDPEIDVRQSAVEALTDIGGGQAVRALGIALKDTDAGLRLEAVESLEEIGGQSAMRLLTGALEDPDDTVRHAANAALAELAN